ncbi:phosphopantetheine-binding protein [Acuticoccus sediminis]|uniref:Phosphopantetheine-binding protein n=1 Tax=Acuticoccus sediminis TaxID=2184697 RepID=A0A8B2NVI3_9HYPH|nr:DUF6005 family protein [Acuticoccus sediminis]RAI03363.1 phosphopantetheine-binding protein [Acuticoccus sediminis]
MTTTRNDIIAAIETVLRERLANRHMAAFGPDARLGPDLALDSLMTMNLLLHLETDHGLVAPEEAIATRAAETVGDFADLYLAAPAATGETAATPITASEAFDEAARREGVHGEDYIDIKVHCFVSCVADAMKRAPGVDHRPLYFGVWDAPFVTGDGSFMKYHEAGMDQEFFRTWAERLYGCTVRPWYDARRTKAENLTRMNHLLARRTPHEDIMVMLDMFHLQGRENIFNKNPFPHYLLLERTEDAATWLVRDVDYRWEGRMPVVDVAAAISQPTVEGGYVIDRAGAHPPHREDLAAYFEESLKRRNPLMDSLREIVAIHAGPGRTLAGIEAAVAEFPILLVRKYAYEHGFAFFWRALRHDTESFEAWCEEIEALIQGLRALNYDLLKLARTGERTQIPGVLAAIDRVDQRETRIKRALVAAYEEWLARTEPRLEAAVAV